MRVAGQFFEIPDAAWDRTEADEWADGVPASVLPNITTWEHARSGRAVSPWAARSHSTL